METKRLEQIGKTKKPIMIWVMVAGLLLSFGIGYVTGCRTGQKQINAIFERIDKAG